MSETRVVITGLGVVAPNGHGIEQFSSALQQGRSGIERIPELGALNFACQVAGKPKNIDDIAPDYLSQASLLAMNDCMVYAAIAAIDCWRDAGFAYAIDGSQTSEVDWDTGAIIGTGVGGADTLGSKVVPKIDAGKVKRLGSTAVEQTMASAPSANIGGLFGLGGQVTTNSSACTTGSEAVANGFYHIRQGRAKRMLVGGTEASSQYISGGFDAMRVLARGFNDKPQQASRPMSASAVGFVPGAGAGMLMLESLDSAKARGAKIYAELIGAEVNCGGQRQGGSITAPNPAGVVRCIQHAMQLAQIDASQIDAINGHLTATMADPMEVKNWQRALACTAKDFPLINSTKSMIGHCLGAAGGLESVATVLQLQQRFIHASINCEDLHPELTEFKTSIPHETIPFQGDIIAKSSFGFGDVNACLLFKRWSQ